MLLTKRLCIQPEWLSDCRNEAKYCETTVSHCWAEVTNPLWTTSPYIPCDAMPQVLKAFASEQLTNRPAGRVGFRTSREAKPNMVDLTPQNYPS
jgi:hypothetical protein